MLKICRLVAPKRYCCSGPNIIGHGNSLPSEPNLAMPYPSSAWRPSANEYRNDSNGLKPRPLRNDSGIIEWAAPVSTSAITGVSSLASILPTPTVTSNAPIDAPSGVPSKKPLQKRHCFTSGLSRLPFHSQPSPVKGEGIFETASKRSGARGARPRGFRGRCGPPWARPGLWTRRPGLPGHCSG